MADDQQAEIVVTVTVGYRLGSAEAALESWYRAVSDAWAAQVGGDQGTSWNREARRLQLICTVPGDDAVMAAVTVLAEHYRPLMRSWGVAQGVVLEDRVSVDAVPMSGYDAFLDADSAHLAAFRAEHPVVEVR